jgi:phenylalanyl-tRNA synthetase beta chain
MNIKITHNWLLEYLDTDATPYEIQNYLSLCGPSIESVTKIVNDYVYDIEVISNRIDYASVIGIARESVAILPMFGKKAKLKKISLKEPKISNELLSLSIKDPESLCPRKLAVIMNVKVGQSPQYIKERLENCGIRSLNNLIDVTNYIMLETGQPTHVFDYDRIKTATILIRKAKNEEKIITLDNKSYLLNNDVVFDDGTGRIIDLPGIMGLKNSVVTENTKRIIFWTETNNPKFIRRTSMKLGIRTVASSINEKNPDPEAAKTALLKGISLYEKIANAKIVSSLYDNATEQKKHKILEINYEIFDKLIGINIDRKIINNILKNLGFFIVNTSSVVYVTVPSWRVNDISIPEDLVEEVARIYGYNKIPSVLQPVIYIKQPKDMEDIFVFQNKIKLLLKHLGLNEVINYSMVSKEQFIDFELDPKKHLRLANSLSKEIEYLRTCLTISLFKNIKDNTGKKEIMKFFEIGKVYLSRKNDLPEEIYKIGIATNTNYLDLKGIIEAIYQELNIDSDIDEEIKEKNGVFMAEIDFMKLVLYSRPFKKYQPINPYAVIKLDKTFEIQPQITYEVIRKKAFQSKLLQKIEIVTLYQNKLTLRFLYSSNQRNITEKEAKKELEII